jgi:MoaA/NifB/PqqE/SkfB family radical SAM enzyme
VSHHGDVFPSGFLPVSAGNIRKDHVADLYRHSPLFTSLRDPSALEGNAASAPSAESAAARGRGPMR